MDAGTAEPIPAETLEELGERLATRHGVAAGGDRRVGGTISVDADDIVAAVQEAREFFRQSLAQVGIREPRELAIEAVDEEELDRRLEEPNFPELVGVAELAELLEVSRQRASELARRDGFPRPIAWLAAGPVWTRPSVERFAHSWVRHPGRPRTIDLIAQQLRSLHAAGVIEVDDQDRTLRFVWPEHDEFVLSIQQRIAARLLEALRSGEAEVTYGELVAWLLDHGAEVARDPA